jgi:hypothetical protein
MNDLDKCWACEKGVLRLSSEPEILSGDFGGALKDKVPVPYTFETRWLICDLCGEQFLTPEDDARWNKMSEELKVEFKKRNTPT